jgi:cytochrome P450
MIPRTATKPLTLTSMPIPSGTTLMIVPAVINLNPSIWGDDAAVFNPSRWEDLPETAKDPYAMITLSGGPRICIGRVFAELEFKVVLTQLLRRFRIIEGTQGVSKDVAFQNAITLRPAGGLRARFEELKENERKG